MRRRTGPGARRARFGLAFCALLLLCAGTAPAAPDGAENHVVLRSGHVLTGKIVGEVKSEAGKMWKIETDFGVLHVPKRSVKKKVQDAETDADSTFAIRRIRVVRIAGTVERRPEGAEAWSPVSWKDKYGAEILNVPNAIVKPGDTIRTGPDGELDLMPHKDVWIRVAKNSEIYIPSADPPSDGGSLELRGGGLTQDVVGRPRGQTFRVRTPLVLLAAPDGARWRVDRTEKGDEASVARGRLTANSGDSIRAGQRGRWTASGSEVRDLTDDQRAALEFEMPRLPSDDMVWIPKGEYRMGGGEVSGPPAGGTGGVDTSSGTDGSWPNTLPFKHRLEGFLIDRHEVRACEYADFLAAQGVSSAPAWFVEGRPPAKQGDLPVYGVTWIEADAFARWAGKRLPGEAQWAAAARGPKGRTWPFGGEVLKEHMPAEFARPGPAPLSVARRRRERKSYVGLMNSWALPAKLQPVDAPTYDVTPFGVRGLVTGAPEWVRDRILESPFAEYAEPVGRKTSEAAPEDWIDVRVGRGVYGVAVGRFAMDERNPSLGMRCVVEFKNPK